MKYLSKINRGVLLTLAVVLAVAGYLIANTLIHNGRSLRSDKHASLIFKKRFRTTCFLWRTGLTIRQ